MTYHVSKARVLYNTLCGRLVKPSDTVTTYTRLASYPLKNQCRKCAKIAKGKTNG